MTTHSLALIQSALFGDSKGGAVFNDVEAAVGSANITISTSKPIVKISVAHGSVIDGIKTTYNVDGSTTSESHGTSTTDYTDKSLTISTVTLGDNESIIAISGRAGSTKNYAIRVVQLNFIIYDSSTAAVRLAGPFGGTEGTAFRVTANGSFVAFGGYAINTNSSLAELKKAGKDGGLYGLTFSEIAYRAV